ncbi:hypothetical protein NDA11_006897 [Ustilago hordei]|nr:hypothetical protein NDA11_006897 [Ustilago hordei]KAJ1600817.1 hypothetical protein NDA14_004021 [Ustilago hordei]
MTPTSSNPTRSPTLDASDTDAGARSHPSLPPPLQATSSSKDSPSLRDRTSRRLFFVLLESSSGLSLLGTFSWHGVFFSAKLDRKISPLSIMSRPAKFTLAASVLVSGLTVWGVHYMQEREREVMYRGVERDEERQAEKKRKRLLDLQINQEKEAAYQKIQPTAAAASSGTSLPLTSVPSAATEATQLPHSLIRALIRVTASFLPLPPASVESIDSELSCHAILEGYLGSPEHMSSACAECFLRIRGLQDLEAARKASLESLFPFGMPSEVFLSHLYAQPTPVTAKLEREQQEQRVREFDAKYTSLNEPYRVIADRNAKFQAEAEARGDTDSIKSCNATIASLATSAATVTSSLLENNAVCNTSATTPEGTLEPVNSIVQGMIETVANAVLATHANMAPLIVNTVTIPGVTVDDVDDQREALRLKGRGTRALGYRANECPPSVDMCDETHLASPITHHPQRLVLLVKKLGIWFANMQNREYENRVAKRKAKEMVHVKNLFVQ